ncbi:MAG: Gfo/Idh/MocA family oxidoreductase [Bryobacteraceae bacterium]|jgi:predicted dehydrogenase
MSILDVTILGGGMITHDQILPSLYHLQRQGVVGQIAICALNARPLRELAQSERFARAFPGQSFDAFPSLDADPDAPHPALYAQVIANMPPRNLVVVALPDHLHCEAIMAALAADQHVLSVKPLVLKTSDALAIEREARTRGLLVAAEYHKRFDDRSLMARRAYRQGLFGEFKLGACCLLEKWYYRHSNFQNWCTVENSDAFTYIGCHYVDLVHFITGLLPVSVSVYGVRDNYPNGREGFLWTDARVIWSNGACLNVQNALGFPDAAPGSNTQGLTMYCAGADTGALIAHSDQYRGLSYSYLQTPGGPGSTLYAEPSPDYFQYVDLGGGGLTPVGYGYRSIEHIVRAVVRLEHCDSPLSRSQALAEIDQAGIIATPANSSYNERVIEAARWSILNGAREAIIDYNAS